MENTKKGLFMTSLLLAVLLFVGLGAQGQNTPKLNDAQIASVAVMPTRSMLNMRR